MPDMTPRQRILASARKQRADRLPFFHWWRHLQTGWAERDCRNRGMGIAWLRPPYVTKLHDIEVTEARAVVNGRAIIRRTFTTPVGTVFEDEFREPGTGQWKANRSWLSATPWLTAHLIKGPEDYPAVKYMAEHTEYIADYFPLEQAIDWLGEDGILVDALPHSPFMMFLIYWVGTEGGNAFLHLADYPELVTDLLQAVSKSREPLYEIAAKSPAPASFCGDNIDGGLIGARLFEQYCMPEYEKQAAVLHRHDKLMLVHMDGRLDNVKHLIPQTPIDIIEAFHPTPMGDLGLAEALQLWADKVVWLGFPSSTFQAGPQATVAHMLELLTDAIPGDRFAVEMSTENQVSNENLCALTSVLEKVQLPITIEAVERIARELR